MPVSHLLARIGRPSAPGRLSHRTVIGILIGTEDGVKQRAGATTQRGRLPGQRTVLANARASPATRRTLGRCDTQSYELSPVRCIRSSSRVIMLGSPEYAENTGKSVLSPALSGQAVAHG